MKRFVRLTLIFVFPIIVFFLPYIIGDPFMILRSYKVYYPPKGTPLWINNNRGFVSTQMYRQYKDDYHWDSFIFGSSRTGNYRVSDWKKYLPKGSACFHFDGYGESLYNIYKRLNYVDGRSPLNHVIICIDDMVLSQASPDYGHLWCTPPVLENGHNWTDWHLSFLKAYTNPDFLRAYLDFSLTHQVKPYMVETGVIDTVPRGDYDITSNEAIPTPYMLFPEYDTDYFTPKIIAQFNEIQKGQSCFKPIIKQKQIDLLSKIHEILEHNHTNYKIIINPTLEQKKLAQCDMDILDSIFGNHLYDFSGKNKFTEDYHHFLDPVHYSPQVASEIMRIIYINDKEKQQAAFDSIFSL
jgi:hypothetical protein